MEQLPASHTLTIQPVSWQTHKTALTTLRHQVFVIEQGVPVEEEVDNEDPHAQHFLVYENNQAVACARLVTLSQHTAKIGRFAVLPENRKRGIGLHLLDFILATAKANGSNTVTLSAQLSAITFYEQRGFNCNGDIFLDAGIEHKTMQKIL